jgi:hypothetical protein
MMVARISFAVIAALALGAGVAVAATQLASSSETAVCVNDTNGLMRAASECREGEHAITIGGGGDVQATQNGTFTVPWGQDGGGKTLPLTGITLSGRCETAPPFENIALAEVLIEAAAGATMDVFSGIRGDQNPTGRTAVVTRPISNGGTAPFGEVVAGNGTLEAVMTSNNATASITMGAYVDSNARNCIYLWQAFEAPN